MATASPTGCQKHLRFARRGIGSNFGSVARAEKAKCREGSLVSRWANSACPPACVRVNCTRSYTHAVEIEYICHNKSRHARSEKSHDTALAVGTRQAPHRRSHARQKRSTHSKVAFKYVCAVVPAHDPANTKTQHSAVRAVDTLHGTSRRGKKAVSDVWRGWCQSTAFSFAIASTCDGSPVVTWRGVCPR
jgi:hypothetical protein